MIKHTHKREHPSMHVARQNDKWFRCQKYKLDVGATRHLRFVEFLLAQPFWSMGGGAASAPVDFP
jgi:hypothetical protein